MHVSAHLDVDAVALEADELVTVMLQLDAPKAPDTGEPRLEHTAVVVLDRSGSMQGDRLDHGKRALQALVDRLDDRDKLGLVVFDHEAQVLVPADRVGALGRPRVKELIASVDSRGTTDLSSGYLRGLQEARRVAGPAGATVLLLSDGHANAGITDPDQLCSVARQASSARVTTSTIGIGTGYDETILAAIAQGGHGNHSFAEHAEGTVVAVAAEIDGLLAKTVQAASLLIRPLDGVAAITLLNDLPATAVADGVLVELGDFYGGDERRLVLEIAVPSKAALGLAKVAELEVRYVELPNLREHVVTLPISVNVVPADVAAGRVPDPEVRRERLIVDTQKAKKESERLLRDGDVGAARNTLTAASAHLAAAPPSAEVFEEQSWIGETLTAMGSREDDYTLKRIRASRLTRDRGYRNRRQGGEV